MARPHPIVCVAAEFAYGRGRGTHQAHVAECLVKVQEILVSVIGGSNPDRVEFAVQALECLFADGFDVGIYQTLAFHFAHLGGHPFEHLLRHIFHFTQECDCEGFVGQFLLPGTGPETVFQVIMFHRAVGLYLSVTAMVVCYEQSLCRDDLPGASASEMHDRIFKTGSVHAVNVLCRKTGTEFLHLRDFLMNEHGKPHAFIGTNGKCLGEQHQKEKASAEKILEHIDSLFIG